jgi:hypothetical protein
VSGHECANDAAIGDLCRQTGWSSRGVCNRASSYCSARSSTADPAGCAPAPGSLLIHRDYQRPRRRMQVQIHHIFQLLGKTRIVTQLEALARSAQRAANVRLRANRSRSSCSSALNHTLELAVSWRLRAPRDLSLSPVQISGGRFLSGASLAPKTSLFRHVEEVYSLASS